MNIYDDKGSLIWNKNCNATCFINNLQELIGIGSLNKTINLSVYMCI